MTTTVTDQIDNALSTFGSEERRMVVGIGSQIGYAHCDLVVSLDNEGLKWELPYTEARDRTLTLTDVRQYARLIDELYATTTPREALLGTKGGSGDLIWQNMYMAARPGKVLYVGKEGGNGEERDEPAAIPCHNCGMMMPLASAQVDHYMPHRGGEDASVVKMMRALGLTYAKEWGSKGRVLHLQVDKISKASPVPQAGNISGPQAKAAPQKPIKPPTIWEDIGNQGLVIRPKTRKCADYEHLKSEKMKADKWSTNYRGNAFLTLFFGQGVTGQDYAHALRTVCVNSKLNLVPLCAGCNLAKSNHMRNTPPEEKLRYLNKRLKRLYYPWTGKESLTVLIPTAPAQA